MIVFLVWGVGGSWYPGLRGARRYRNDPSKGWTYAEWRRHVLRALALLIAVAAVVDLWYRATGRGAFLH